MGEWRDEWREANRANWDERVPIHVSGDFYDVASFKRGQERLQPFEIDEVGDVTGKELLHLQCHFGIDTLSWARRGASVTGLDFSAPAVEAARGLAKEMGLEATFVHSDVYEAVGAAGLNVELLHEYDYTVFPRWPILEKSGFDTYRLPEGTPKIPLMYSLRARKA